MNSSSNPVSSEAEEHVYEIVAFRVNLDKIETLTSNTKTEMAVSTYCHRKIFNNYQVISHN